MASAARTRWPSVGRNILPAIETGGMAYVSATVFAELAEPLRSTFGDELTLRRDGNVVRWEFAGQLAVVELLANGSMRATFIDRASIDAVSKRPAAAAYRSASRYSLTNVSCSRLIADMVDFFSGVREPDFTFVDALPR